MNINYKIKALLPYLYIFLFAYIINAVLFGYLPQNGEELNTKTDKQITYNRYNTFFNKTKEIKKETIQEKEYFPIDKIRVKAIFIENENENFGLVILEDKNTNKSSLLSVGQTFKSFTLVKLFKNYVLLKKDEKKYKVILLKPSSNIEYSILKAKKETLLVKETAVKISRTYLNTYVKNLSKVWNNISIEEVKINNKIQGFKINKITKKSFFTKLGLKKGDIIKRVNNKNVDSYEYVFSLYKNINKIEYFLIEVLRDNKTVELNYEIN